MRHRTFLVGTLSLCLLFVVGACDGTDDPTGNEKQPPADAGDVQPDAPEPTDTETDTVDPDVETPPDDGGLDTADGTSDAPGEGEETGVPDTGGNDPDFDGLTNAEEKNLCNGNGSDPNKSDTDEDGLSDFEEYKAGTNACKADTDGDGASDYTEVKVWEDLNPNDPITYNDGVLDGDRWFIGECDRITSGDVSLHSNSTGNWKIGLPTSFANYTDLSISGASAPVAAAAYDNTTLEVAGFMLSRTASSGIPASPEDALPKDVRPRISNVIQQFTNASTGPNYTTHSGFTAATGEFAVKPVGGSSSVRDLRDSILAALGPFEAGDVSGLPNSSGAQHDKFKVVVTVIQRPANNRDDNQLLAAAIAPYGAWDTDDKVKYRVSDLTNTTNIAESIDTTLEKCSSQTADKDRPKTEFYWVLDQTGSMREEVSTVIDFSSKFEEQVSNTSLDYRMGVTNMDPKSEGRLEAPPGWHDTGSIFNAQVTKRAHPDTCVETPELGCDGADEDGLYNAREGMAYMLGMRSQQPSTPETIRANANIITIVMSDDNANRVRDGQISQGTFNAFFDGKTTMFSIVDPGTGSGSRFCNESAAVGSAYAEVSQVTGGKTASICGNLESTITDIIQTAAGEGSNYTLDPRPITPSLKVYLNDRWVPRSAEDGYRYFPASGSIAFFGSFRPDPNKADDPTVPPDRMVISYDTFNDKCKKENNGAANCPSKLP